MPPPNFAPASGPQSQQLQIPKATNSRMKDAIARIRASLLSGSTRDARAAESAIDALLNDPNVATDTGPESAQLKSGIAERFNEELANIFAKELDQQDQVETIARMVALLSRLFPLIGAVSIIKEWWDPVLRPVLKDANASDELAAKARELTTQAASQVPITSYKDEPPPEPAWPHNLGTVPVRRSGDAPYPVMSAAPSSPVKSRPDSSGRPRSGTSAAGRTASQRVPSNMHFRFVQHLFDLYTQVASAPLNSEENDEDKLESMDQMQSSNADLLAAEANGKQSADAQQDPSSTFLWQALEPEQMRPVDGSRLAWKGNLEAILIMFGEKRPKEFFHHLSNSFDEPMHRIPIMLLLTIFLRLHSIHTYHITKTALLQNIANSLQLDTATTMISLCLTAFIILIPHMPNWFANGGVGGVPVLLSIFARMVDWRKLGPGWEQRTGEDAELEQLRQQHDEDFPEIERISRRLAIRSDVKWKRLESRVDTDATAPPDASAYFTILYGLFPCNVLRFLRAPMDYFRKANCHPLVEADWDDLINESDLQIRSEPIVRKHLLHPAIITHTAEGEITDKTRWAQHDTADVTAECFSLAIRPLSTALSGSHIAGQPAMLLSDLFTNSNKATDADGLHVGVDEEAVDADRILSSYSELRWGGRPEAAQVPDRSRGSIGSSSGLQVGKVLRPVASADAKESLSSLYAMGSSTPGPPSPQRGLSSALSPPRGRPTASAVAGPGHIFNGRRLPLDRLDSAASSRAPSAAAHPDRATSGSNGGLSPSRRAARLEVYAELKFLQRENLLLRNELNFELYLKDQHLQHIGRLHQDRIKSLTRDAERQNLYAMIRSLRARASSLTAAQERQRSETQSTKARHAQWESELNAKLKWFREEKRRWTVDSKELRAQIETYEATIADQSRRLDDDSSHLFDLETEMQNLGPKVAKLNEYEAKNAHLTKCLALWSEDVKRADEQRREMERLLSGWREMELLLHSGEVQYQQVQQANAGLNEQLEKTERENVALRRRVQEVAQGGNAIKAAAFSASSTSNDAIPTQEPHPGNHNDTSRRAMQDRVEALEAEVLSLRARADEAEAQVARYESRNQRGRQAVGKAEVVEEEEEKDHGDDDGKAVDRTLKELQDSLREVDVGKDAADEDKKSSDVEAGESTRVAKEHEGQVEDKVEPAASS